MRDTLKSKEYYDAFLQYQNSRIEKKILKLDNCDEEKKQKILISLTGYEIDLLKAEFSAGASNDMLKRLLVDAINIIADNTNITYDDLLTLLSLTVILDVKEDVSKLIEFNRERVCSDRLLKCLSEYITKGSTRWDYDLLIRGEYDGLNQIFDNNDKIGALENYLSSWYKNHSSYAWYNTHLLDTDTYCGYWSFEAAAIARILGIEDDSVNSAYYPKL